MTEISTQTTEPIETPLAIVAEVSRLASMICDRLTGGARETMPLFSAQLCVEGLKIFGIEARIMFGRAAWIEVARGGSTVWAGCWEPNQVHFWAATQYGEIVDLNLSASYKSGTSASPPMLWSKEIPLFCRYIPEGIAEIEEMDPQDRKKLDVGIAEIQSKCLEIRDSLVTPRFGNEAIICGSRRVLDDSRNSFREFQKAIGKPSDWPNCPIQIH